MRSGKWDLMQALITPPIPYAEKFQSTPTAIREKGYIIIRENISGVYISMQPTLNKVYESLLVKIRKTKDCRSEFAIITLENGKTLLVYRSECEYLPYS